MKFKTFFFQGMEMRQSVLIALICAVSSIATPVAWADGTRWYGGVGTGEADVDVSGFEDDTSLKLFGGYEFNKYLAVEGGYTDLGEFDLKGSAGASIGVDGVQFVAVGNLPVGRKLSVFAKGGLYRWDADADILGVLSLSDDGTDSTFGFGVRYRGENPYGDTLALRLEWERFDIDGDDIGLVSLNFVFSR